jgi:hypothetical protein
MACSEGHGKTVMELLAKLCLTSAPGHPLSLAGFRILFDYSKIRQSLLRPGAAFASGKLQNLPDLQLAQRTMESQ